MNTCTHSLEFKLNLPMPPCVYWGPDSLCFRTVWAPLWGDTWTEHNLGSREGHWPSKVPCNPCCAPLHGAFSGLVSS